jgi:hypothetical protein
VSALHVGDAVLDFVRHPHYADAHPGEACDEGDVCERCAIARRRDTGDLVLLWQCEGKNWGVSRHDPEYARHRAELLVVVECAA